MRVIAIGLFTFSSYVLAQQPDAATWLYNWQSETLREWIADSRFCMRQSIERELMFGNRNAEVITLRMLPPCGEHLKKVVNQSGGDGEAFVRTLAVQEILSFPTGTFDPPKSESKPENVNAGKPGKPKDPGSEYVFPLGVFADPRSRVSKLAEAKVPFYTEVVNTERGAITRLRAGPFQSAEEAERVRLVTRDLGFVPGTVNRRK